MTRIGVALALLGLLCMAWAVPHALGADALLVIQRPTEPELVKHRYTEMTACTVDLASERNLDREPKGTRLSCIPATDIRSAKR
jgi:hypothetical protein